MATEQLLAKMEAETRAVFQRHAETCAPCARAKLLRVLLARANDPLAFCSSCGLPMGEFACDDCDGDEPWLVLS